MADLLRISPQADGIDVAFGRFFDASMSGTPAMGWTTRLW
jgi:hypothetical protein